MAAKLLGSARGQHKGVRHVTTTRLLLSPSCSSHSRSMHVESFNIMIMIMLDLISHTQRRLSFATSLARLHNEGAVKNSGLAHCAQLSSPAGDEK
jgi:hypothetical protein